MTHPFNRKNYSELDWHTLMKWWNDHHREVVVFKTDESGPTQWVIGMAICPGFWLGGFPTEAEAVTWAKDAGLTLEKHDPVCSWIWCRSDNGQKHNYSTVEYL